MRIDTAHVVILHIILQAFHGYIGAEINCPVPVFPEKIISGKQGDLMEFPAGRKNKYRRMAAVYLFKSIGGQDDLLADNMTDEMLLRRDHMVGHPQHPD